MTNFILFDDTARETLKPLTYLRPVCDIRVGIMTIREKWEHYLGQKTSTLVGESYLAAKYPMVKAENNVLINGSVCPTPELVHHVQNLKPNQILIQSDNVLALCLNYDSVEDLGRDTDMEEIECETECTRIVNPWDVFVHNASEIQKDFTLLTHGRKSQPLSKTNVVIGEGNIFMEEGAVVEGATLNATHGPIYIGKNAEIMENSSIRGPFAMCEHAIVKMSAKIYGGTTLGPYAKAGGELENVVIFGYSNKVHDGFMGNSVIAEWCNIGADSNASNLKNTYEEVRLWSIAQQTFVATGQQFCGVIMADHSKCGINTMFNTGTVVGVSCNIFGSGYQRNFIPSFAWGGPSGLRTYDIDKALVVAERSMARRNKTISEDEKQILKYVYRMALRGKNFRY